MQSLEQLACALDAGRFDSSFQMLYGCADASAESCRQRYALLLEGFRKSFGKQARDFAFFSAPGRTELGGNHTDHQQGRVLAASVDLDVIALAAKNDLGRVRVVSEGFAQDELELADLTPQPQEANTSAALIRGVCAGFAQKGYSIGGFDVYTTSNVLKGSGLSSSASFEILLGTILNEFFAEKAESSTSIAQIGQYAENVFFKKPSGLLDQMACATGGVIAIDFKEKEHPFVEPIPLDLDAAGYVLCIVDTGADHAGLTVEYSAIPAEMGMVAMALGKTVLREVSPEQFYSALPSLRRRLGDRALMRAMHFYGENQRALQQAQALKTGDMPRFLQLTRESGASSFQYLQNVSCHSHSTATQPVALALALAQHLLAGEGAFRVHGGGFAGTIQAYVPTQQLEHFKSGMEALLGKGTCHIVAIRPVGGVRLTESST